MNSHLVRIPKQRARWQHQNDRDQQPHWFNVGTTSQTSGQRYTSVSWSSCVWKDPLLINMLFCSQTEWCITDIPRSYCLRLSASIRGRPPAAFQNIIWIQSIHFSSYSRAGRLIALDLIPGAVKRLTLWCQWFNNLTGNFIIELFESKDLCSIIFACDHLHVIYTFKNNCP